MSTPKPTEQERELFEERAAIIEFEGKLSRADAERIAKKEIMRLRALEAFRAIPTYQRP